MTDSMRLCQIDGDGIGQEVVPAAIEILRGFLPNLNCSSANAGWGTFNDCGVSVPAETIAQIREDGAAIFGAVSSPSHRVEGYRSAILEIRQQLGLYANIRPVDSRFGDKTDSNFNFVVVRENSEGLYAGLEETDGETAFAKKVVTKKASHAIGKAAVLTARNFGKNQITVVHKANILPNADGLFRDSVLEAIELETHPAESFSVNEMLVDTAALKVVADPEQFGVIVTTNLYGDILSDVASYWCGGLEMAPSLNINLGSEDEIAVCEPVHGSAPDIAGKGIADPRAAILSLSLLSRVYWQNQSVADQIEAAVTESLTSGTSNSTTEICEAIGRISLST